MSLPDWLKLALDGIAIVVAIIALVLVIADRWKRDQRDTPSKKDMESVWQQIDDVKRRVSDVEAKANNLPTHRDLDEIDQRMTEVKSGLSELNGMVKQLNNTLAMINQHLLTGSKS